MSKRGRKTKYHSHVLPYLKRIPSWRKQGMTEEQIAKRLEIAYSTLSLYKNKYSELSEALKKGKEELIEELEDSLYRKAMGYEYEEMETWIEEVDGMQKKRVKRMRKVAHPDTGALAFALKNQVPAKWADYTARKVGLDSEEQQIRIEKLKAETEHMRVVTNLKSGETGEEMARQQTAAIADMINSPEADRILADFLGDNDE